MCLDQQRRCTSFCRKGCIAWWIVKAIGSFTTGCWKFNQLRFADISIIYLHIFLPESKTSPSAPLRTKAAFTRNIQIAINTNPISQHDFFNENLWSKQQATHKSYLVGGQLPPSWKMCSSNSIMKPPMFMVTIFGIMCFSTKCWKPPKKSN